MERSLAERLERKLGLRTAELPDGMPWLYLAAAIFTTPVFSRNVFVLPAHLQTQAFVGNAMPFMAVPAAVHAVYRFVMPGVLRRARSSGQRLLAHVIVSAVTAALMGVILWSFTALLGWRRPPLSGALATDIVMTWAFVFPAKLVLAWRDRARAIDVERIKAEYASARNELYAIQSRAHPHFLFNAINTVASLIPEDPQRAEETLLRFADVLRYILETSTSASTPLARDVAILREYLEIQRARFERLHYSIEVEAGLDGVRTPPLLLLPLVENAVLHGVAAKGSGTVSVRIRQQAESLALDVEDDGPGQGGSSRQGSGIALRDLRRRLELLYGGAATVATDGHASLTKSGHAVKLRLPLGLPLDGQLFT
ncbi:Autolysis histidine kinase LytS [Labilithrix luteola]|uniref:Autolysis histidine kinase LytS n=1 Tax=Labilithrix luteola TaxID=1391654 RepID=A0A0K1PUU0_9BACT|nr:histidine kinase [Labilithrix luteola]AKU97295.1 Autolysis histidine kinase LytS [Labilithrix luteola]